MVKRFVKYNPAFLEKDQLIANFVVRGIDYEMIMRIMRENETASNQHVLVIGPRGSGKTTLVHRIAIGIEEDPVLRNGWYPLLFSEESYNAVSASEFWLEALFHLAEQTGEEKWMRAYKEIRNERDEERLGERAFWQLLEFADIVGKKILLVVENLHMLLADFSSKEQDAWSIRHALINEPRLMLLATATNRFEEIDNPSFAMFEMFRILELKSLDDEECNTVWELIAGEKLSGEQIRPIRILTGGNLRLVALIARFGAQRSFRKLLDDLIDLIDEHTDYFKSHLDAMAPTERKVYLALAELWSLSTAREIAEAGRLDVNKTSSLLNRLVSRGAVIVEEKGKRTKWYRLAEGIYNIYYLMRRRGGPATRVRAAVKFMVSLYGPASAVNLLIEETNRMVPDQCREHFIAYEEIVKNVSDQELRERIVTSTPKSFLDSPFLNEVVRNYLLDERPLVSSKLMSDEVKVALTSIKEILDTGYNLFKAQDYVRAIKGLDELIAKYRDQPEAEIAEQVAKALLNKGIVLGLLNRSDEEIQVYDELIAKYRDQPEAEIAEQVAKALFNKGLTLGSLNRRDEEMQVYDDLIAKYGDRPEAEIAVQVAMALLNKGVALSHLNRRDEEMQVYDELIGKYGDRPETEIVIRVARALLNKGVALSRLNRGDEEMQVYDDLIAKYGDRPEAEIAVQVAKALLNKGVALSHLNRRDEEMHVYDDLIAKYGDRPEAEIAVQVAKALFNKGLTLGSLNRGDEEMQVYDDLIAKYGDQPDAAIVKSTARALYLKGVVLENYERYLDAENVFVEAIERNPNFSEAHLELLKLLLKMPERQNDALAHARKYVYNLDLVEQSIEDAISLFLELAGSGYAKEALDILVDSPAEPHLEPLVVALRLYTGQEIKSSIEILEVAKDVVKKIEARKQTIKGIDSE